MKFPIGSLLAASLLSAAFSSQAAVVNVSLGQTSQNFILTGLGPQISNGDGTYSITQGSCLTASGKVTCTMSGNITSASMAPYGSGTYSFVTTYSAADVLPIQGQATSPSSNNFFYQYFAPDVNMTLTLVTNGVTFVEPMVTNAAFVSGSNFSFSYVTGSSTCAGLPNSVLCSQANVGQYPGATVTGPITISASFTVPDATTAPEPAGMALTGMCALLGAGFWLRRKRVKS